jgi:hypothetical protein
VDLGIRLFNSSGDMMVTMGDVVGGAYEHSYPCQTVKMVRTSAGTSKITLMDSRVLVLNFDPQVELANFSNALTKGVSVRQRQVGVGKST